MPSSSSHHHISAMNGVIMALFVVIFSLWQYARICITPSTTAAQCTAQSCRGDCTAGQGSFSTGGCGAKPVLATVNVTLSAKVLTLSRLEQACVISGSDCDADNNSVNSNCQKTTFAHEQPPAQHIGHRNGPKLYPENKECSNYVDRYSLGYQY